MGEVSGLEPLERALKSPGRTGGRGFRGTRLQKDKKGAGRKYAPFVTDLRRERFWLIGRDDAWLLSRQVKHSGDQALLHRMAVSPRPWA